MKDCCNHFKRFDDFEKIWNHIFDFSDGNYDHFENFDVFLAHFANFNDFLTNFDDF